MHAQEPHLKDKLIAPERKKCESKFEEEVLNHLSNRGFKIKTQFQVGYCRIDIVVGDSIARLAIECDGYHHNKLEKKLADLERQAMLELMGWKFERIRSTCFWRDQELAMLPVYTRLQKMGIKPI